MIKRILQYLHHPRVWSLLAMGAVLIALWTASSASASPPLSGLFAGPPPSIINYQGLVHVGDQPYNGNGYFKFAVVNSLTEDGTTNYWANDGTANGEPFVAVELPVINGLFNVLLGDTSLGGMTQPLNHTVFRETNTYLRVWFSQTGQPGSFEALEPNQRIASVAYALRARFAENAPSGPSGPVGPTGPQGIRGPSGPPGIQGPTGPSGPEGERGPRGFSGPTGPVGPTGPQGVRGPTGPQGPSGPSGPPGPAGPEGPEGSQGPSGPRGPSGPSGPAGVPADIYTRRFFVTSGDDSATANCDSGDSATGGGFYVPQGISAPNLIRSEPSPNTDRSNPRGWVVQFGGDPGDWTIYVVCMNIDS